MLRHLGEEFFGGNLFVREVGLARGDKTQDLCPSAAKIAFVCFMGFVVRFVRANFI